MRERVRAWNGCSGTLAPRAPADAGISMQVRLVVLGVEQFMAVQSHDVEEQTAWVSRVFRVKRQALPRNLARHTIFPKVGAAIATTRVTIHHPHPRESSAPACCCTCAVRAFISESVRLLPFGSNRPAPGLSWLPLLYIHLQIAKSSPRFGVWGLGFGVCGPCLLVHPGRINPFILYPLRMPQEGCC